MFGLQEYAQDGDRFASWVLAQPAITDYVQQKLLIIENTRGSASVIELQAGRNAANGLYMLASANDFADSAALFYRRYETYCWALMCFL